MRVFIDTNVLIDFCALREDFYTPAAAIISLGREGRIELCASATTFVNAFYVLRKHCDRARLYQMMTGIAAFCHITAIDRDVVDKALARQWADFEDCAQCVSAEAAEADIIVTRNKKDFGRAPILVQTPIEFLNAFYAN